MALEAPLLKSGGAFAFQKVRHMFTALLQEGVVGAMDFKASQRAAGANMSVDVAAGACAVQGDATAREGLYLVVNDGVVNVAIGAAHATLPRVDQLVLYGNTPSLSVVPGVATSGATLDNRSGVVALPGSAVRLADILVPAASTSVTTANLRDRGPWARGASWLGLRPEGSADLTTTSATFVDLDPTNLARRFEFSGGLVEMTLVGPFAHSASGNRIIARVSNGGATLPTLEGESEVISTLAAEPQHSVFSWTAVLAAGSYDLRPQWRATSGTVFLRTATGTGREGCRFRVREIVGQNASNS